MNQNAAAACANIPQVGLLGWSEAGTLRHRLVAELQAEGHLRSRRVADAFEAVPREVFVPGVELDEVYRSTEAIVTKRVDGVGVSSASAPNVMAIMLEQLGVRPGHRVLEIGAGTGYNAALLAHLVGPTGSVTTLDIDDDIVVAARDHLAHAGFPNVRVLQRDGALGCAEGEPFDRVMLTVGSRDIAPAWREQLARPDGRLVMPLRMRGPQRSIAFQPENGHLVSSSVQACAFIPLRGLLAGPPVVFQRGAPPALSVTPPDDNFALPSDRIEEWLRQPRERWPTGVSANLADIREALHVWLVVHEPGMCSVYAETGDSSIPDLFGSGERVRGSLGVVASEGMALLGWSAARELHVEAAPQAADVAQRLAALIRTWDAAGRPGDADMHVRAYARGEAPAPAPDEQILDERWTRFLIAWRKEPQPPASFTV